jgi:hypothetical protein
MFRNIIFVLMYYRHRFLDPINYLKAIFLILYVVKGLWYYSAHALVFVCSLITLNMFFLCCMVF